MVEPVDFTLRLIKPPTRALRPVIPINARTSVLPRLLAGELAGAYSVGNTWY